MRFQPDAITLSSASPAKQVGSGDIPASASGGRLSEDRSAAIAAMDSFRVRHSSGNEMKVAIVVIDPQGCGKKNGAIVQGAR